MNNSNFDVILAGGGVMGCATAYYLLKFEPSLKIAIIEKDPTYERSSTVLSDGNTRIQFNIKENIQMSIYGLQVLETFAEDMAVGDDKPDIAFHRQGNLFLVDEDGKYESQEGLVLQQSLGCRVDWLEPNTIRSRYPLLAHAAFTGGTLGYDDGTMNPWSVLTAYKNKSVQLGAHFIHAEITQLHAQDRHILGVQLADGSKIHADAVVNTAGAWAAKISQTAGVSLPILPIMRQVFVVETNEKPETRLPGIFFPGGLYMFHEHGGQFVIGKSLPNDPEGFEFRWNREIFMDVLWPELVEHIPAFDRLKLVRGWAGLYEVNTLDGNAILGEWPELKGYYLANGFSGHGFQQGHAVGRYITELILGKKPVLDLSIFSPQRILENAPVFESKRRLI